MNYTTAITSIQFCNWKPKH